MITHQMTLLVSQDVTDEKARQMIVDHIILNFPDAEVDGPPILKMHPSQQMRQVSQQFTSKMFDNAFVRVLWMCENWLDEIRDSAPADAKQDWLDGYEFACDYMASIIREAAGG